MEEQKPKQTGVKIPWKTFAKHLAVVGGLGYAGYLMGGASLHPVMHRRVPLIHRQLEAMSPTQRKKLGLGIGTALGLSIPVARGAHRLAMSSDIWHDIQRQHEKRMEEKPNEKVASVLRVYESALGGHSERT